MYSLLTGNVVIYSEEVQLAKKPLTADAHHAAMRRLLLEASTDSPRLPVPTLLKASRIHAEAAKTAPASLDSARTPPRDGDAI